MCVSCTLFSLAQLNTEDFAHLDGKAVLMFAWARSAMLMTPLSVVISFIR